MLASDSSSGVPQLTSDNASPFTVPGAFGPFRVMHQIGVGVLGPVFRTYDSSADRLVAVKVFQLDITPEQAETLVETLESLATIELTHPGPVSLIDVGLQNGVPYMAQEYVAGESIDVALRQYAPASVATAMQFISQIAAAVDAAHERGVVHGALHFRDVLVTSGTVRVTGFGVVKALEQIGLRGKIRRPYTAPEVIAGRAWGGAADRFAVAAIVYELLTGRRPAGTGDQFTERLRSVAGAAAADSLEEVFAIALSADPEERHSTASGLVSALAAAIGEEGRGELLLEHDRRRADQATPLDLLAGLELHREDQVFDGELALLDAPDSHGALNDDDEPNCEQEVEQAADSTAGRVENPTAFQRDAGESVTAEVFSRVSDPDIEREGIDESEDGVEAVASEVPVIGLHDDLYADESPVFSPPTSEPGEAGSYLARGLLLVVVVAIVVSSLAYFAGVWRGSNDVPPDEFLRSQSASSSETSSRESGEELDGTTGAVPMVGVTEGERSPVMEPTAADMPVLVTSLATTASTDSPGSGTDGTRNIRVATFGAAPDSDPATLSEADASSFYSTTARGAGWLLVRTEAPGATVMLDGVTHGQTPLSLAHVTFGTHQLNVSRPGFVTFRQELTVSALNTVVSVGIEVAPDGRTLTLNNLAPGAGSMTVQSRPLGARVSVNGTSAGVTPVVVAVPEGRHQVLIERDGYQPWVTVVEVITTDRVRVNASLERRPR